MQVDALTAYRSWWDGAGTVQHPAASVVCASHVQGLPEARIIVILANVLRSTQRGTDVGPNVMLLLRRCVS
jgi:pyridoxine/pyridoxamine 5'-phosphate oxidase